MTAWGTPHGGLGLPGGLYQFMALTELRYSSALWVRMGALARLRLPTRPQRPPPPPIESIRDITGTEKKLPQKPAALK